MFTDTLIKGIFMQCTKAKHDVVKLIKTILEDFNQMDKEIYFSLVQTIKA